MVTLKTERKNITMIKYVHKKLLNNGSNVFDQILQSATKYIVQAVITQKIFDFVFLLCEL